MPLNRPPFDPSRPMAAITNFLYSGETYLRGDAFPHPGLDLPDERKLRRLYDSRKIGFSGEETRRKVDFRGDNARAVAQRATSPAGVSLPTTKPEPTHAEQLATDQEAMAEKLVSKFNKTELFTKASGLAGVTKTSQKIEIARALVKAGRAGDGDS